MTKSLMISIQPKHLVNILNGYKTLELRKSVPKDFNGWVYIYATKGKPYIRKLGENYFTECSVADVNKLNGKIVARFWFDEYETYYFNDYQNDYRLLTSNGTIFRNATITKEKVCLTCVSINDYGKGKMLYTWHIKQLEIFDTPLSLSDFYKATLYSTGQVIKEYEQRTNDFKSYRLKRPPQSWQYVYVRGNLRNE